MSAYIFIKNIVRITNAIRKKGGLEVNLAAIDPELQEDFIENFHAVVSQRKAINKTLLGRIAKGYADIDEAMRIYTWNCTYIAVKEAANDYLSGKINSKKFFAITKIDTMMADAQTLNAIDLLEAGKSRELAGYVAYNNTLDMHTAYKITEVSGIERKQGHRFQKFCARAIIRPDLVYRRGIRPLWEGLIDGDGYRAIRGLINIAEYSVVSMVTGSVKIICIAIGWLIVPIVYWTVTHFRKDKSCLAWYQQHGGIEVDDEYLKKLSEAKKIHELYEDPLVINLATSLADDSSFVSEIGLSEFTHDEIIVGLQDIFGFILAMYNTANLIFKNLKYQTLDEKLIKLIYSRFHLLPGLTEYRPDILIFAKECYEQVIEQSQSKWDDITLYDKFFKICVFVMIEENYHDRMGFDEKNNGLISYERTRCLVQSSAYETEAHKVLTVAFKGFFSQVNWHLDNSEVDKI